MKKYEETGRFPLEGEPMHPAADPLNGFEEGEFAQELGKKLSVPVACPDHAWTLALDRVQRVQRMERRRRIGRWYAMISVAAAAMVMLAVGGYRYLQPSPPAGPLFLTLDNHTIAGLEAKAEVNDGASVRAMLRNLSLPVALDPNDALKEDGAPYRLIGARKEHFETDQAVELLFEHQGKPAILVIAPRTGDIAKAINRKYEGRTGVFASRAFGGVMVAAVGTKAAAAAEHRPDDLLVLVGDPNPVVEPSPTGDTALSTPPADETSAESPSLQEGIVGTEEPVQEMPAAEITPIPPESESVPDTPLDTTIPEEVKQII